MFLHSVEKFLYNSCICQPSTIKFHSTRPWLRIYDIVKKHSAVNNNRLILLSAFTFTRRIKVEKFRRNKDIHPFISRGKLTKYIHQRNIFISKSRLYYFLWDKLDKFQGCRKRSCDDIPQRKKFLHEEMKVGKKATKPIVKCSNKLIMIKKFQIYNGGIILWWFRNKCLLVCVQITNFYSLTNILNGRKSLLSLRTVVSLV